MKNTEKTLARWMRDYARKEGQHLLEEFEQAQNKGQTPQLSEAQDEKFRALIENNHKKKTGSAVKWLKTAVATAAAAVLILAGILPVLTQHAEASRVTDVRRDPFLNYTLTENEESYCFQFHIQQATQAHDPDAVYQILSKYVPKGFTLIEDTILIGSLYTPVEFNNFYFADGCGNWVKLNIAKPGGTITASKAQYRLTAMSYLGYDTILLEGTNGIQHLYWVDEEEALLYNLIASGLSDAAFWELAYQLALP